MKELAYPRLPEACDARVKIPKSEHAVICARYQAGDSIRSLARAYSVNKRLIQFILFPERVEAARANRDWKNYYDREKHRQAMARLRAKQRQVNPGTFISWEKVVRERNRPEKTRTK